nr:hypothetical protein [Chromobacterium sp. ASV5]
MSVLRFFALAGSFALLAVPPARAGDAPSLSVSGYLFSHQTGTGNGSRGEFSVDALYPTRFGALYLQDGEGGWALPAPLGFASLGVASEPVWGLGGGVSQSLWIARYGFDLPRGGALSLGYAGRLGDSHPGKLVAANLQAPLGSWRGQDFSLQGWASLADQPRRRSLERAAGDGDWRLEQANLLLVMSHPLSRAWALQLGAGSRWSADAGGGHTAGWQTLLGLSWTLR